MRNLQVEFKKTKNGKNDAIRLIRPDGTSEWSPLHKGMVKHDLAHFVVESFFSLKLGFYGEILEGTTMEIMRSQAVTQVKQWSPDIFIAETLAGSFQNALMNQQDFSSFCNSFAENQRQIDRTIGVRSTSDGPVWPKIDEKTFEDVCAQILTLWKAWDELETGEKLDLVWHIKG